MRGLFEIVRLELRALVRTRTAAALLVGCFAWMTALPHLSRGDGTAQGAAELYVRYSLGGAFLLTAVTLLACATGVIAREREARRLQLTLVRPVRHFTVVIGKMIALLAVGAVVLAASAGYLLATAGPRPACRHVIKPVMESPRAEAEKMYDVYVNDPETPDEIRKAPKAVILRILAQRAADRYVTVPTNAAIRWTMPAAAMRLSPSAEPVARLRFTNMYDVRADVLGEIAVGGRMGVVSNLTRTVVEIPLLPAATAETEPGVMSFSNLGGGSLMLRPRKDVDLLLRADSFAWNLLRATLELLAMLSLLVGFGVFLGSALGRPVAMFVAAVVLLVATMSPSVIQQYPDELESDLVDRIGLALTRCSERVTRPFGALSPMESLSRDECVEWSEALAAVAEDCLAIPLLFALLAAAVMPRKQETA